MDGWRRAQRETRVAAPRCLAARASEPPRRAGAGVGGGGWGGGLGGRGSNQ